MTCHTRVHPCDISKPLPRKSKGEIRKDLLNEYDALGKPGSGKTLRAVVQDVEDEMSKNLEFQSTKTGKPCISCAVERNESSLKIPS